jgi:hypothetical protein
MPRQLDQLPPDATTLARKIQALERQVAELRASRRAAYTTVTEGAIKIVPPGSDVPAAIMASDLGDGSSGFQANSMDGSTYARLEAGEITFGSPGTTQFYPTGVTGTATGGELHLQSGLIYGGAQAHIILASGDSPLAIANGSNGAPMISLEWDGSSGGADMIVDVSGVLLPRNMAWGTATITPTAANTPISATVGGLNVRGGTFYGFASASTITPGSTTANNGVTGVSTSSVSSTGLTVWLTRQSVAATPVNWLVIGI